MKQNLYKALDVWKKLNDNTAVRYRCLEILGEHKFCVQSADFFYSPIDEEQLQRSDCQFVELLMETLPEKRSELYSSLEEAIMAHDIEFDNL